MGTLTSTLRKMRPAWRVVILWIVLLLLAGVIRCWSLDSIPPPLWRDEAKNGLDVLPVLHGLKFPLYFERLGGRESLFYYIQGLFIAILGPTTQALRLPAALIGLLTIPVFYLLARALFPRAPLIGYITSGALAVSFWHLSWSRFGERGILVPLFVAGVMYALWRGWRGDGRLWLAVTGALLGVGFYTYTSNRILPLVVLLLVLSEIPLGWRAIRRQMTEGHRYGWDVVALVTPAVFIAAPLVYYFWTHPLAGYRVGVVSALSKDWSAPETWMNVLTSTWRVFGMFLWQGDLDAGRNMSGRPVWDHLLGAIFALGLVVCVTRWRRAEYRLVLLTWGVMLLPTILSVDAPNQLRALGALPPACLMIGLGLDWAHQRVKQRVTSVPRYCYPAVVTAILLVSGAWTVRDYFFRWAPLETTYNAFQGEAVAIADYVSTLPPDVDVYLPLRLYNNYPQIIYLTAKDFSQRRSFLGLTADEQAALQTRDAAVLLTDEERTDVSAFVCLTRGLSGKAATVFLPPFDELGYSRLSQALKQVSPAPEPIKTPYGQLLATAYRVSGQQKPWKLSTTLAHPLQVDLNHEIELLGYDMASRRVQAGQKLWLSLYWRRIGAVRDDYLAFAQLVDMNGQAWAGGGNEGDKLSVLPWSFPTSWWPGSDIIPVFAEISLPRGIPAGKYRLMAGLYQDTTGKRLEVLGANGQPIGDSADLGIVAVGQNEVPVSNIQHPLFARVGDHIQLLGYDLDRKGLIAGKSLNMTLYWKAMEEGTADVTVFTHLLDAAGRLQLQYDSRPQAGRNPTSTWMANEIVQDAVSMAIPADFPCGTYALEIGMYAPSTGVRLPMTDADGRTLPQDRLILNGVEIGPCR